MAYARRCVSLEVSMAFGRVFLFLLALALLEIMVLAAVADLIGWPVTVLLVIATSLLGSALFRRQGLETWRRLNLRVNQGEMPGREMVESVMLLFGGMMLITPGFISDVAGLVLLVPTSRRRLADALIRRGTVQSFTAGGGRTFFHMGGGPGPGGSARRPDEGGVIIEGEAHDSDQPGSDKPALKRPPR
jgi:UPF0716 protein FxsA